MARIRVTAESVLALTPRGSRALMADGALIVDSGESASFFRLDAGGRLASVPVPIEISDLGSVAFVRWRTGYLVATAFPALVLRQLSADGAELASLAIDESGRLGEAVIDVDGDHALLVWTNYDHQAVRAAWIDLGAWTAGEPFPLSGVPNHAQYPQVGVHGGRWVVAWAESVGGRLGTRAATLVTAGPAAADRDITVPEARWDRPVGVAVLPTGHAVLILTPGDGPPELLAFGIAGPSTLHLVRPVDGTIEPLFQLPAVGYQVTKSAAYGNQVVFVFEQSSAFIGLAVVDPDLGVAHRLLLSDPEERSVLPAVTVGDAGPRVAWTAYRPDTDEPKLVVALLDQQEYPQTDLDDPVAALLINRALDAFGTALASGAPQAVADTGRTLVDLMLRHLGPEDPRICPVRSNLGQALTELHRLDEAETELTAARRSYERNFGPYDPETAICCGSLAKLFVRQGRVGEGLALLQRARIVLEVTRGPDDSALAWALHELGEIYKNVGRPSEAVGYYENSLQMRVRLGARDSVETGKILKNLSEVYLALNDRTKAREAASGAVQIFSVALGETHYLVGIAFDQLASVVVREAQDLPAPERERAYEQAARFRTLAVEIVDAQLGANHPMAVTVRANLAQLRLRQGRTAEAKDMFREALSRLGTDGQGASIMHNLGVVAAKEGDLEAAEKYFEAALERQETEFGPDSPQVIGTLQELAVNHARRGDARNAVRLLGRSCDIEDRRLAEQIQHGGEKAKRRVVRSLNGSTAIVLGIHTQLAPNDGDATRLALTTVLRRKGRILDELGDQAYWARADRDLFRDYTDRIVAARDAVARGQDPAGEIEELEAGLAAVASRFTAEERPPVTIEAVQAALAPEEALVEFVFNVPLVLEPRDGPNDYPYDLDRAGYLAYVLPAQGSPAYVDLGPVEAIESAVERFREAIVGSGRGAADKAARELERMVMQPVRGLLGAATKVTVAPEGVLQLVPFEALVDENNRYLIDSFEFTYLSTGRELVAFAIQYPHRRDVVVFADPDFGGDPQAARFVRLPESRREVDAVTAAWPAATAFVGSAAGKEDLMSVRGPRILHIASHAFFQDSRPVGPAPRSSFDSFVDAGDRALLTSGIALARANEGPEGVLTALEATSLDLRGTRLVVLSACETGVGLPEYADGVYGLRRTLALAGAETLVLSLWKVDSEICEELMRRYHRLLANGTPRSAALREAKRGMRESGGFDHPFDWAAFVSSGRSGSL